MISSPFLARKGARGMVERREPVTKREKEPEPSDLIGGVLNLFGLKIDLGELLESPEKLTGRLEGLREKLKEAGGKEVLSEEEWRKGGASISGHIKTGGLLGKQEFHVGTVGRPAKAKTEQPTREPPETVEPPIDVFDEDQEVIIVADVPGADLEDLVVKVEGNVFSLSTRGTARRSYQKELRLEADLDPDSLKSECRNGVLEVRVRKQATGTDRS